MHEAPSASQTGTRSRVLCVGFVFDPYAEQVMRAIAPKDWVLDIVEEPARLDPALLAGADVLMTVAAVTDAMMAASPRLRLIQKWGTGYDKIDTAAAARHGIAVAITAGANADTVAEHAIALMLAVMRRIALADRAMREGRWIPAEIRPVGQRLFGRTVGIVGYGNIGRAVARQLRGFEAKILYHRRSGPLASAEEEGGTYVPLDDLLAASDVVTLHCPGGTANRNLIGRKAIARMKPGAVLINVARGEIVDEAALVEALSSGHLSGAGFDVYGEEPLPTVSPLRALDNVVLTPHSAGSVLEDIALMAGHAFTNISDFLAGRPIREKDRIVVPEHPRAVAGEGSKLR